AAVHTRIADGLVNHRLFITGLVIRHEFWLIHVVLLQRLANTGNVAVAKDAEHAGDGALAVLTVNAPLLPQELNACLADRLCLCSSHLFRLPGVHKAGGSQTPVPTIAYEPTRAQGRH